MSASHSPLDGIDGFPPPVQLVVLQNLLEAIGYAAYLVAGLSTLPDAPPDARTSIAAIIEDRRRTALAIAAGQAGKKGEQRVRGIFETAGFFPGRMALERHEPFIESSLWQMPNTSIRMNTPVTHLAEHIEGRIRALQLWIAGNQHREGNIHP